MSRKPIWIRILLSPKIVLRLPECQRPWIPAANVHRASGSVGCKMETLRERLSEKEVWHVVREYAAKGGIDKLAPTISAKWMPGFATAPEANWSKSSFCSITFD